MDLGADARAILEAVPGPALMLDGEDRVACANRRALALLPPDALGRPFGDLCGDDGVGRYLDRCRGSSEGLLGALALRRGAGPERHRCRGARVALSGGVGILLTLEPGEEAHFAALSRKVAELNVELRERRHAEAVLAESLRERDLLLRELQHRVKNNVHMLAGLLQGAGRETGSGEARAVLRDISARFAAVGAVQQFVYGASDLRAIESAEMIEAVARGAATLAGDGTDLSVEADPLWLPIEAAVPVALVLNELVTNAVKYGRPEGVRPRIEVRWRAEAGHALLVVRDNGPGFRPGEAPRRASGLGLVRGLLRQLGGSLTVEAEDGACCTVRFPLGPRAEGEET